MGETGVRKATAADVPLLARTLGRAFHDDPALAWANPHAGRRQRDGERYFAAVLKSSYMPKGEVYVTGDGLGVAVWAPPERWETSTRAALALLPLMLTSCRTKLPRALKMVSLMEAKHRQRTEPHYYLPFIGTDPDGRGRGRGSALLTSMLDRCDEEGRPAYLEATSIQNQALYRRHRFEVLEELHWPGGGPPFWPMWRSPG
jgi:ribosomal protein S18 acetylase RimI-like enzyme